jgi:hypothetical protein
MMVMLLQWKSAHLDCRAGQSPYTMMRRGSDLRRDDGVVSVPGVLPLGCSDGLCGRQERPAPQTVKRGLTPTSDGE